MHLCKPPLAFSYISPFSHVLNFARLSFIERSYIDYILYVSRVYCVKIQRLNQNLIVLSARSIYTVSFQKHAARSKN